MNMLKGFVCIASAGALLALGACTSPADTHRHGPRQTMRDSAMPAERTDCPYDTASHDMHRPRDDGRMPTAAHPGCREQQTDTQAAPAEAPAQPQ
jgi:hypothetical protein